MRWLSALNRRLLLRYRLEYVVALGLVYGVRALNPKFAWNAARAIGRLLFKLGVRRDTILKNLRVAFPDWSEEKRMDVARSSYEHFASMAVDIIFQRRMLSSRNVFERIRFVEWAREYMDYYGVEGLRRRAHRILFMTAHLGNWELGSGLFGLLGVRVKPVYRALRNPFVNRLLSAIRLDAQEATIERRGAVAAMMETFDAGGNVGFLFDQEAVHGIFVPFFGQLACTHKTPAVLARDHDLKIFFGCVVRRGDFLSYEARGQLLDFQFKTDDRQADLHEITAALMRRLEDEIRLRPEQYLWMHRRWKRTGVHGREHVRRRKKAKS